jgi:hypothetical protein
VSNSGLWLRGCVPCRRAIARPTWATFCGVDPSGRGQTGAGHKADLLVAEAVLRVFGVEVTYGTP